MYRLIPEYGPVAKLQLSFVHPFFNTRFHFGKAICDMVKAAAPHLEVELFVDEQNLPALQSEFKLNEVDQESVSLTFDSPGRAILAEGMPIFCKGDSGEILGLVFRNPFLDEAVNVKAFSERFIRRMDFTPLELGFDFYTAGVLVNEEVMLLSEGLFRGESKERILEFFSDHFPSHTFYIVPSLAGELSKDLDMFLWPVAPGKWIVSEYPAGSDQETSIQPALRILQDHGHRVFRVPGLERIVYDDIDCMPNYTNGVILNRLALVPAYHRLEDQVMVDILQGLGFDVISIDCSQIILTNSGLHCISRTVPVSR